LALRSLVLNPPAISTLAQEGDRNSRLGESTFWSDNGTGSVVVSSGSSQPRVGWLLAATPIMVILAHYAAVLPHEFAHSIMAWLLGIKDQPGNIDWGGTSVPNLLFLIHIDENVDYTAALAAGKNWQVALTAFAGPGIANLSLFLLSRYLITKPRFRTRPVAANFLFWFLFMNLGNMYDYVPMRVFSNDGDVHNFIQGTGMNPWVIYVVGSYLVLWGIVDFYRNMLPLGLQLSGFFTPTARGVTLVVATVFLFGYFANPSLLVGPDPRLQALAATSIMAIPPIVILLWRRIVTPQAELSGLHASDRGLDLRQPADTWRERSQRA
jgi:hypothetical protein